MTGAFYHVSLGINRRLIKAQSTLGVHDPVILAVPDQHRTFELACPPLKCVVRKFLPGIGEVFGPDDPSHALLNRGK